MNDEIREKLDYLVLCKAHIENDLYTRQAYWEAEYERTADELADAWELETAGDHAA